MFELYTTYASSAAGITFHRSGQAAVNFGLDTDNELKVGGFTTAPNAHIIQHSGRIHVSMDDPYWYVGQKGFWCKA